MTFAARDFSPRRGVSDEHIPQWICEERATKSGRKRPAALRVAPNLACGFVARRLQPHGGDAPSSRLATGQIGRNERHRTYASDHLVHRFINTTTFAARDFWPRRGANDAHTLQRSVRSEQRRLGRKAPPPRGLRRVSVLASLLLGHSPTAGDAPSLRLARTENRRNKRGRSYETEYLELFRILNLVRISDFGLRICLASNGGWPIVR